MNEAEAKLVRMAGEIHQFFRHQGDASYDAAANHIRQFWSPVMRQDLLALVDAGNSKLPQNINRIAETLAKTA